MIKRELTLFAFVGSLTVLLDFTVYRALALGLLLAPDWAKAIGFIVGTLFAYVANRFWTFGQQSSVQGSLWRFSLLYIITCVVNVCVNSGALLVLGSRTMAVESSFLFATGLSACLNFLGMKYFVFNPLLLFKERS